jgi:hypothetical protein
MVTRIFACHTRAYSPVLVGPTRSHSEHTPGGTIWLTHMHTCVDIPFHTSPPPLYHAYHRKALSPTNEQRWFPGLAS